MSISTYGELKSAVENWLDRDDLSSRVPEFITLAKSRIDTDVRILRMEKRFTATISDEFTDLPDDYIEMRSVNLNTSPAKRLQFLSPGQIAERYSRDGTSGEPVWYSVFGNQLQLWPAPDGNYEVELVYVGSLTDFATDADTNWLLENHPGIYLYGALVEAEPFIGNDERTVLWAEMYKSAKDRVNSMADEGRYGPSLKMTSRRMTP